ncbi:hypothetical protein HDU98_006269 [Podochytrium sp. JEL0797]|nr:hypothetical protein HDU98_006269 [Podochytrium sp. JEL0797]
MDVLCIQVSSKDETKFASFIVQSSIVESVSMEDEQDSCPLISSLVASPSTDPESDQVYATTDAGHILQIRISHASETSSRTVCAVLVTRRDPISHMSAVALSATRDLIVIIGDMCDGEFLEVDFAGETVTRLDGGIQNLAPVLDFKVIPTTGSGAGAERMYLTSGVGKGGTVREVRCGVPIRVDAKSDEGFTGITAIWGMKQSLGNGFDSLVAVSFVSATRLFWVSDEVLEDVTAGSGVLGAVGSLVVAVVGGGEGEDGVLVQVWGGGVVVVRPDYFGVGEGREVGRWLVPEGGIAVAAVFGEFVVVSVGVEKAVVVLRVCWGEGGEGVSEVSRLRMDVEPSCMHAMRLGGRGVCVVGTYAPGIVVLGFDEGGGVEVLMTVALGLRDGAVLLHTLPIDSSSSPRLLDSIRLGVEPVQLVSMAGQAESQVLAISDALWRVSVILRNGKPVFDVVNATVGTPFNHTTTHPSSTYLLATRHSLSFLHLHNNSATPTIRPLSRVSKTPRRIVYDKRTRKLVVACNTRVAGSDAMTGEIQLVDPGTGERCLREVLGRGEACYSMTADASTVWNIKDEKRYICIGTWGFKDTPAGVPAGRVLVYSLKETESRSTPFRIRKLGEFRFPEMVFAVCTFMKSYLLAASGNFLYQLKIEATTRALHCGAKTELRYPIRSLSVSGSLIFVSCQPPSNSSVTAATPNLWILHKSSSDEVSRSPSDCLALSSTQVLVSDKSGEIFCLQVPGGTVGSGYQTFFKTAFSMNLGETVMRLHCGQMDSGFTRGAGFCSLVDGGEGEEEEEGDVRRRRRGDVVYGCSLLGGVFSFRGVKEGREMDWLVALQEVLAEFPGTRPLLGNSYAQFRASGGRGMRNVVDGELVKRYSVLSLEEKRCVLGKWKRVVGVDDGVDWEAERWVEGAVDEILNV